MILVLTVSSGTSGTYESYDFVTPSYDTNSPTIESLNDSRVESGKSYEGTGGHAKKYPRGATERVSANIKRRARRRELCGRGRARRRRGVAA